MCSALASHVYAAQIASQQHSMYVILYLYLINVPPSEDYVVVAVMICTFIFFEKKTFKGALLFIFQNFYIQIKKVETMISAYFVIIALLIHIN